MPSYMKRFSEISGAEERFPGERISITQLYDQEIVFVDFKEKVILKENKIIVQFRYMDKEEDFVFITRSDVVKDKLATYKESLPFIGTLKKVDKYITIV